MDWKEVGGEWMAGCDGMDERTMSEYMIVQKPSGGVCAAASAVAAQQADQVMQSIAASTNMHDGLLGCSSLSQQALRHNQWHLLQ